MLGNDQTQTSFIPNSVPSLSQMADDNSNSSRGAKSDMQAPLAAKLRPEGLDDFVGQSHLVGEKGPIRKLIKGGRIPSMIFWGPPGCGKTTLARIIANTVEAEFVHLSAVASKKADVKKVVEFSRKNMQVHPDIRTILFLDEIHRFNKAQQDFLLPYVEDGTLILIGATTENPSFEVISALLSRSRVFVLKRHKEQDLEKILNRGIAFLQKTQNVEISVLSDTKDFVLKASNGDPRTLLNALEMAFELSTEDFAQKDSGIKTKKITLTQKIFEDALQHKALLHDKKGEQHYNLISALHKSMRASNVNASLYWLARMLEAGEDPIYVARRMFRFAAEDIGNSDVQATILAASVFEACEKIGMPECNVHLAQLAIYLARAPKDNSAYIGYQKAAKDAKETLNLPVPLHLRNAETDLMDDLGYGQDYIYDHDVKGKKSGQQCMPDKLVGKKYVKE
jgi:putative ATPase